MLTLSQLLINKLYQYTPMLAQRPSRRKKGISLSLSRDKNNQRVEVSKAEQVQVRAGEYWQICPPSSQQMLASQPGARPPVIVYRFRQGQPVANRQVSARKSQSIGKPFQVVSSLNTANCPSVPQQINLLSNKARNCSLVTECTNEPIVSNFSTAKQKNPEFSSKAHLYERVKIQGNLDTNKSRSAFQSKQNLADILENVSLASKLGIKTPAGRPSIADKKARKSTLDSKALQEIQNKLNKLIEFTTIR